MEHRIGDSGRNADNADFAHTLAAERRGIVVRYTDRDHLQIRYVRIRRHEVIAHIVVDGSPVAHVDQSLLEECLSRGIAFVPFCPLGWPRGQDNPVLTSPVVTQTAARLGITPAQTALQWLLQLAPNVLLIPGTGSIAHLRENVAAEAVTLDDEALRTLDGVGA